MKMRHYVIAALPLIVSSSVAFAAAVLHQEKSAPPAARTREQILKEGPAALQQNCTACHGPDKWEGTNRDREGWTAIVAEMSRQMAEAQMRMSDDTANLIIDYLTLTRPQ